MAFPTRDPFIAHWDYEPAGPFNDSFSSKSMGFVTFQKAVRI